MASPYTSQSRRGAALPAPPDPAELREARLALHWAAQVVAATGDALLRTRSDDSHTNTGWNPALRALTGRALTGHAGVRVALEFESFAAIVVNPIGAVVGRVSLAGHTLDQVFAGISEVVAREAGPSAPAPALTRRDYDMPSHPVADGAPFAAPAASARTFLADLYGASQTALATFARARGGASPSPVCCWPHHFDIATLLTLSGSGEDARTIGIGMSPGDGTYDEPYWYVNPWPYPAADVELPTLARGRWHRAGWTGAVLRLSELPAGAPEDRFAQLEEFLTTARDACMTVQGRASPAG